MVRRIRSAVETRSARLALPVAKKPLFARLGPGVALGYRRNATAGTWVVRVADGRGGNWTKAFGTADDHEDANGQTILTYMQACDRARTLARAKGDGTATVKAAVTVGDALDAYAADLEARGGDAYNLSRIRGHVPAALARRPVAVLTANELRHWRNILVKEMAPASVNRVANTLRAALNLAADGDETISRGPWESGLKALPGAESANNVILKDVEVQRVVREAYKVGEEFGLFVEVAAATGARPSQIWRIEAVGRDHVMMPASKKGKGTKTISHRRVPIPPALAKRLQGGLRKPSGERWKRSDHTRLFRRAVEGAGLDPEVVTIYALRHSSIVRQLLAGVPIRLVAVLHDTSVAMIERHYSAYIDQHLDDAVVRKTLLPAVEKPRLLTGR
jgi:integrase